MFKKLIRKIRTWNPKHLPNPFYSPSLAFVDGKSIEGYFCKTFVENVIKGIESDKPFTGFTDDEWQFINNIYKRSLFYEPVDEDK